MLPIYPESAELTLALRPLLHPLFQQLPDGISEFTFANLYLFRQNHNYSLTRLADETLVFLGRDQTTPFFMLPFGLPEPALIDTLFRQHGMMKCASTKQAGILAEKRGYQVVEDRDNFDYLYRRQDLAELGGRDYHKKRNLIKAFVNSHDYAARPFREEYRDDALLIVRGVAGRSRPGRRWRRSQRSPGAHGGTAALRRHLLCGITTGGLCPGRGTGR